MRSIPCPVPGCTALRSSSAMMCVDHWKAVTGATKAEVYLAWRACEHAENRETVARFEAAREAAIAEAAADQRNHGSSPLEAENDPADAADHSPTGAQAALVCSRPIGWGKRRLGRPRKVTTAPVGPAVLPHVVDISELEVVLPSHNIVVAGRRTSLRFSAHMWDAVHLVAAQCGTSVVALATEIDARRGAVPLTRAIETYVLAWLMAVQATAHAPPPQNTARRGA